MGTTLARSKSSTRVATQSRPDCVDTSAAEDGRHEITLLSESISSSYCYADKPRPLASTPEAIDGFTMEMRSLSWRGRTRLRTWQAVPDALCFFHLTQPLTSFLEHDLQLQQYSVPPRRHESLMFTIETPQAQHRKVRPCALQAVTKISSPTGGLFRYRRFANFDQTGAIPPQEHKLHRVDGT